MAEYALFYNSVDGDRVYDADSFSDWLRKFFTTGVFTGDLQVVAGSGMQIVVGGGYCNIDGKVKIWKQNTSLSISNANAKYNRIDTVVVERNDTDRDFTLKVITGAASDNPTPTPPVRGNGIYQLVLAQITVNAGTTALTQAQISDKRPDPDVCGIVAATVNQIDFSQIQAQFDSYAEGMREQYEALLTAIQQELDRLGAGTAVRITATATITATWTGSAAPYTQDVAVSGLLAIDTPHITPVYSDTLATALAQKEAWSLVSEADAGVGKITFTCFEDKPTTAIPIQIEVLR